MLSCENVSLYYVSNRDKDKIVTRRHSWTQIRCVNGVVARARCNSIQTD